MEKPVGAQKIGKNGKLVKWKNRQRRIYGKHGKTGKYDKMVKLVKMAKPVGMRG